MDDAVAESLLSGPVDLLPVGLPDPDDEHVLAAARVAGASVLLTFNLSDFPATLVRSGLSVLHPDVFFTLLLVELEADVLAALAKLRRNLSRPALSALDLTHAFERLRPAVASPSGPVLNRRPTREGALECDGLREYLLDQVDHAFFRTATSTCLSDVRREGPGGSAPGGGLVQRALHCLHPAQ